ncbi:MAG: 1-deoxy-D-xylulose-5-phosphate reductoisomerase [Elusimicrobia bacterium]|nr:1-deoxy-D-xylulose-5-phosphate reductoisomerase [Elusimicrobiota bacterium]
MKNIVILGSTGSIGVNVLKVVASCKDRFRVTGLTGNTKISLLENQIKRYHPAVVVAGNTGAADQIRKKIKPKIKVLSGPEGLITAATWPGTDIVVSSLVGALGLEPTLAAIDQGSDIALANKEILVMAGAVVMARARRRKVKILPVDSEHSAIWQCLKNEPAKSVSRIILTASGGPFWKLSRQELAKVDVSRTLAHPTWNMGRKVTVDSATLMNKGFEIIEAHHLFGIELSKIQVLIHPESIIHSLVEFSDGSVIAQLAAADMKLPIQYALCHPERIPNKLARLDLARIGKLNFYKPEFEKFPCLQYAYQAARLGGTMPAVMSAADEVAVELFLAHKINFKDIPAALALVMKKHKPKKDPKLEDILAAADWSRLETIQYLTRNNHVLDI